MDGIRLVGQAVSKSSAILQRFFTAFNQKWDIYVSKTKKTSSPTNIYFPVQCPWPKLDSRVPVPRISYLERVAFGPTANWQQAHLGLGALRNCCKGGPLSCVDFICDGAAASTNKYWPPPTVSASTARFSSHLQLPSHSFNFIALLSRKHLSIVPQALLIVISAQSRRCLSTP